MKLGWLMLCKRKFMKCELSSRCIALLICDSGFLFQVQMLYTCCVCPQISHPTVSKILPPYRLQKFTSQGSKLHTRDKTQEENAFETGGKQYSSEVKDAIYSVNVVSKSHARQNVRLTVHLLLWHTECFTRSFRNSFIIVEHSRSYFHL